MFKNVKNHDIIWNLITKDLNKMGITVTSKQAKNKWNQMKKKFRKTMDDNNRTGNDN